MDMDPRAFIDNKPWVMLGDFNIILKINENSNGVNVRCEGMKEFVECIEDLEMEDINIILEEEEMVYYQAYKDAMINEEKLVRQKTKVEWWKEGDANSSYFHNVIKGRFVSHLSNFFGTYDDVLHIEDPNSLFVKKLDVEKSMELIKDVSDLEIKEALFNIKDNKASGPDGYSSKFFLICLESGRAGCMCRCQRILYKWENAWLISDNILLALEFMKGNNWDIGVRNYAFEIDIQKAYDTVSWKFLEFFLNEFRFHPMMINRILICLSTASFSVCVNGETHGFFRAKRRLRQGEPISPYLFTLMMELLNLMVKRKVKRDKRFKYHSGCQKLEITSLFFTDDLLMLCHGDMISAFILRRGLDKFSMSSVLYPSMSKSNAFFCNIPVEVKDEISLVMSFREGVLPIRYLGIPLVSKRVAKKDYRILMEFFQKNFISGKINVYPLLFLWSNKDGKRSMVSVKWTNVCKPKSQGGLGLKSMHE
nr:hypothetical protein [Tanacetum cinerariifolium]